MGDFSVWPKQIPQRKDMQRQVDLLTEIKPLLFLRYDERDNRLYDCKIQSEIGVM